MKYFKTFIQIIIISFFVSCDDTEQPFEFNITVSGQITDHLGRGVEGVKVFYNLSDFAITDEDGKWLVADTKESITITPTDDNYNFSPISQIVSSDADDIDFTATRIQGQIEQQTLNWFKQQQLANGLLESAENSNFVSLYDNALAAMVFLVNNDFTRAEKIFNFFNDRIDSELLAGLGGFSQFRNRNGVPNNNRWLGDNAWMLIALNNHKALTESSKYDRLRTELANWMMSLQDTDGGLFGGFKPDGTQIHKITEGNIDAFNAVEGYTDFHKNLLDFLENDRWDAADKNLVAWVGHPTYLYAMDLHPWSYCMFEDYPISTLSSANRYLTTQTATISGNQVTGYCFDIEKDVVWLEGTGQMAVAYNFADMTTEADFYLAEMDKAFIPSNTHIDAGGFPYATNQGTSYGAGQLWQSADKESAISGGAWYIFAKHDFNPFEVQFEKNIPELDKFWKD